MKPYINNIEYDHSLMFTVLLFLIGMGSEWLLGTTIMHQLSMNVAKETITFLMFSSLT